MDDKKAKGRQMKCVKKERERKCYKIFDQNRGEFDIQMIVLLIMMKMKK